MNQSAIFLDGEGDNYFLRNRAALEAKTLAGEIEWLGEALSPFREKIGNLLEIGCSNGAKLQQMCSLLCWARRGMGSTPQNRQSMKEIAGSRGVTPNYR